MFLTTVLIIFVLYANNALCQSSMFEYCDMHTSPIDIIMHPMILSLESFSLKKIADAIALARDFGAHVHPAHIDRESNGIVAILGDVPPEYEFETFELRERASLERLAPIVEELNENNLLVCSDAHHLWDVSEAENSLDIDDEPYSSSLVRHRLFEMLERGKLN